jgi:hypothetical protein
MRDPAAGADVQEGLSMRCQGLRFENACGSYFAPVGEAVVGGWKKVFVGST